MSQNVTLFQIFGTKLRLPFMFGSGSERLSIRLLLVKRQGWGFTIHEFARSFDKTLQCVRTHFGGNCQYNNRAQTESESSYPSRRERLPNDYIDNNW